LFGNISINRTMFSLEEKDRSKIEISFCLINKMLAVSLGGTLEEKRVK
jgi:hypothetical protein